MDGNLQELLAAWLSGDIDDSALAPILIRLESDDAFRKSFVDVIVLLGQLKAIQGSEPRWLQLEELICSPLVPVPEGPDLESRVMDRVRTAESWRSKAPRQPGGRSRFRFARRWWRLTALASALMGVVGVLAWLNSHSEPADDATARHTAINRSVSDRGLSLISHRHRDSVAVLSQSVDAVWEGDQDPVSGDPLGIGDLRLISGTIQIEFLSGVRLLVRGPADLELRGASEVLLREGTASCFVTEMGRGFRIVTGDMEVIDVGTAFSIDVQHGKQSEVHVLEGSVEIKSPKRDLLELKELHAIRMSVSGPIDVDFSPGRFPNPAKLREQQGVRADQRYELWQQHARVISDDPDVLLHYTFAESDPSALELRNRCANSSTATDGVVIGCEWTEGRWPSKRALLYRNANDRVLCQVPGEFHAVTFLAWVRIDALTQLNTSLLMTENAARRLRFTSASGTEMFDAIARRTSSSVQTVRWELNQERSNVLFSVGHATNDPQQWKYDWASAFNESTKPDHWGQWACLAVTCDVVSGDIFHYRNGELIGAGKLNHAIPLPLDFMELGNFGVSADELERSGGMSQRRFYGAIDELVVSKRIFTPEEIEAFWMNGKP